MASMPEIRLTELVDCGGCAAKFSARLLQELIGSMPAVDDPDLIVGLTPPDDAAVYRLSDDQALVLTLDFFPPIVDDPGEFGAIAATNALNDVFAMGARPLLALSVAVFPESLPTAAVARILDGAAAKVREAGCLLAGGHTLRDDKPVYGLVVAGIAHPDAIWTTAGARPDDDIFLTKPLGTGLVVHAHKAGRADDAGLREAIASMTTLNAPVARILSSFGPHAVTDVTGFGLLGHAYEMASQSNVAIRVDAGALPLLPGARAIAEAGVRTGGDARNREYVGDALTVEPEVPAALVALAFDPQTAGGLLVALPPERSAVFEQEMEAADILARRIGTARPGRGVILG